MRRFVVLLFCFALLAGCGDGSNDVADGPSPEPSTTTLSTPTPSTSPTPPAHETAKQFIHRWQKVADAMQLSGDTSAFDALNDPSCESCATFKKNITRVYAAGGHVEAEPTQIVSIRRRPDGRFNVHQRVAASRYKESLDGAWHTFPGGEVTQVVELGRTSDGWRLLEYSQLAESAAS